MIPLHLDIGLEKVEEHAIKGTYANWEKFKSMKCEFDNEIQLKENRKTLYKLMLKQQMEQTPLICMKVIRNTFKMTKKWLELNFFTNHNIKSRETRSLNTELEKDEYWIPQDIESRSTFSPHPNYWIP